MEWLILLWPIFGIFCACASAPDTAFSNVGNFLTALFCGAIAGPFGLIWFFML